MRVLIQTKSNLVASFQIMDISVSFLKVWSDALVIYQNFIIETPGWNPDSQGAVGGNDLVADRKIIRISCLASDEILVIKLDIAISVKVTRMAPTRPNAGINAPQIVGARYATAVPAMNVKEITVEILSRSCWVCPSSGIKALYGVQ